jgi:hypothetical protein
MCLCFDGRGKLQGALLIKGCTENVQIMAAACVGACNAPAAPAVRTGTFSMLASPSWAASTLQLQDWCARMPLQGVTDVVLFVSAWRCAICGGLGVCLLRRDRLTRLIAIASLCNAYCCVECVASVALVSALHQVC